MANLTTEPDYIFTRDYIDNNRYVSNGSHAMLIHLLFGLGLLSSLFVHSLLLF